MADGQNAAAERRANGQVVITGFENGAVKVALSPGLAADTAERLLYGAMKFLEREILLGKIRQLQDAPRVEIPKRPLLG